MQATISRETVYKSVEEILIEECNLQDKGILEIKPEDNLMSDIGIESVDFLVVVFEIEEKFSIKIPMEEWMQKSPIDGTNAKDNYKMSIFVDNIYSLIQQ